MQFPKKEPDELCAEHQKSVYIEEGEGESACQRWLVSMMAPHLGTMGQKNMFSFEESSLNLLHWFSSKTAKPRPRRECSFMFAWGHFNPFYLHGLVEIQT